MEVVQYLVQVGAPVNLTDREGDTPLHAALRSGLPPTIKTEIFSILVGAGADVRIPSVRYAHALSLSRSLVLRHREIN